MAVLKIAQFWKPAKERSGATVVPLDDSLGLDAFGSETASNSKASTRPARVSASRKSPEPARRISIRTLVVAGIVVLLGALGVAGYELRGRAFPWAPKTGSITFDTVPSGVEVFVGEKTIGRSPTTVTLAAGSYDVRLGSGAQARAFKVAVTAGSSSVQHYEMAPAPAPATTGGLRIQTDPINLPVLVDGVEKGASPVTIDAVDAGDHEVAVRLPQSVIKRAVHVVAGERTAVIISSAAPKPDAGIVTAGWLSATAPISLTVKEGGRVIGSTDVDKLMLSSGEHELEFVNEGLGFRATRHVSITAGKTASTSIGVPNGTLSVNALPWADVFIDGKHVGQTPLGNVTLPIGQHEVTFRHPDLGERKQTVTVTASAVARLGVDLRKQ